MSALTPTSSSADDLSRGRRWGIAALLWLYGISITIFLFSIWGRAVAADTDLLSDAASRAADSEMVSSQVEAWFEGALAGSGVGNASGALSEVIVALPEVRSATADVASDLVRAAAESSNAPVIIDVASAYRPAVPAVTSALASAGVPVGEEQVGAVVSELEPIVFENEGDRPPIGPRSGTARSLTLATLVALGAMVATGGAAVVAARERRSMFRSLLNRLAVSGFTYFVFFQISAWVLDPRGGRVTVRGGIAEVVGAKLWIPLVIAVIAAVAGWLVRHRHRHGKPPGHSAPAAS